VPRRRGAAPAAAWVLSDAMAQAARHGGRWVYKTRPSSRASACGRRPLAGLPVFVGVALCLGRSALLKVLKYGSGARPR
jgi:hypothetical protein